MTIYEKDYFVNGDFDDYNNCKGIIEYQASMFNDLFKPTTVFSAGCAYGHEVTWFNQKGIISSGCDISEWATSQNPFIHQCRLEDLHKLRIPTWDLVICTEVLEHIPEENIDKAIDNLYEIAKEYLVLTIDFTKGDMDAHITVHPREWWEEKFSKFERDIEKEKILDNDKVSQDMKWSGRFFVIKKKTEDKITEILDTLAGEFYDEREGSWQFAPVYEKGTKAIKELIQQAKHEAYDEAIGVVKDLPQKEGKNIDGEYIRAIAEAVEAISSLKERKPE
jgi:hypothetical protein